MRPSRSLPLLLLGVAAAGLAADTPPESLLGFSPARVAGQRSLEQRFDAALDPAELKEWMRRLSARPHHLGSPYGKDDAAFIAAQFRSWGFDTKVEEFRVLFPTPKIRVMEMVAPTVFKAALAEPVLKEDPTSGQAAEQLPVYNAYSIDGDVTGDPTIVGFVDQCRHVCVGVEAAMERALAEGWSMVLEGVHLVPGLLPAKLAGALVVHVVVEIADEDVHRVHFHVRDVTTGGIRAMDKYLTRLDDIRRIQTYVVGRARRESVPVVENANVDRTVDEVIEIVMRSAERFRDPV